LKTKGLLQSKEGVDEREISGERGDFKKGIGLFLRKSLGKPNAEKSKYLKYYGSIIS